MNLSRMLCLKFISIKKCNNKTRISFFFLAYVLIGTFFAIHSIMRRWALFLMFRWAPFSVAMCFGVSSQLVPGPFPDKIGSMNGNTGPINMVMWEFLWNSPSYSFSWVRSVMYASFYYHFTFFLSFGFSLFFLYFISILSLYCFFFFLFIVFFYLFKTILFQILNNISIDLCLKYFILVFFFQIRNDFNDIYFDLNASVWFCDVIASTIQNQESELAAQRVRHTNLGSVFFSIGVTWQPCTFLFLGRSNFSSTFDRSIIKSFRIVLTCFSYVFTMIFA